jgi:branched-chain amino acid transport system substrate-binding protein
MKNKSLIFLGVIIVILLIITIFQVKTRDTSIKVGAVLPLTGQGSGVAEILKGGYEFKTQELRESGANIETLFGDSSSDPKQALSAYNELVSIKGAKVIFTGTSLESMVILPLVEKNKNAILWADATHPDLTKNTTNVLRHASTAQDGASVISDIIIKNNNKKIGIIYQQDDWGNVFNELLKEKLTKNNIEVVSEQIDNKGADFRTQITRIKSAGVDGIVYGVYGPAAGVAIKQTRELGYSGELYAGVGFGLTPDAQKIAGKYADGLYYQEYPMNKKYSEDYQAKYGKPGSPLGYVAYTDLEILMYAIKNTGSTDPNVLVNFIKKMGTFEGKYETVKIQENGDIVIPTTMKVWNK